MDEMHTYIGQKNYCWIWIAVDRYGKKFIDCVFGTRGTETGEQLWEKIKEKTIAIVATDYWKAYTEFIPIDKHIQEKKKLIQLEGYNSLFRHFLARLRRKNKMLFQIFKNVDNIRGFINVKEKWVFIYT